MYKLKIETVFASAHQLRGYKGKCENIHGHNWKVQVLVTAETLNNIGIAIDFHDLKRLTAAVVSQLDHNFLNDIPPFTKINPSSENIAKWIFDNLRKGLEDYQNVKLSAVTVWESDTASVTYYEPEI